MRFGYNFFLHPVPSWLLHAFALHAFLASARRTDEGLTVQTFPVRALTTVVPLVEVVIGPRVVINRVTHVHVPGVPVAELAVVPLGPVRRGIRPIIEGPANDVRNLLASDRSSRKQTASDYSRFDFKLLRVSDISRISY